MTLYSGNRNDVLSFTEINAIAFLNANIISSFTVPGDSSDIYVANFQWNGPDSIFVGLNSDLTPLLSPIVSPTLFSCIEFRPPARYVKGGDVLSFLTPVDVSDPCSVSLRTLP